MIKKKQYVQCTPVQQAGDGGKTKMNEEHTTYFNLACVGVCDRLTITKKERFQTAFKPPRTSKPLNLFRREKSNRTIPNNFRNSMINQWS
jgi:hypothetical protein